MSKTIQVGRGFMPAPTLKSTTLPRAFDVAAVKRAQIPAAAPLRIAFVSRKPSHVGQSFVYTHAAINGFRYPHGPKRPD